MMKFEWGALRGGNTVFVHGASDADLGIRVTTGIRTGPVVRPGWFAVHLAAVDDRDCWRCGDNRPQRPDIGVAPGAAVSRGR